MVDLVRRYGFDPGHPLSTKLSPDQQARLAKAVQAAKLNMNVVNQARPWFAAITLSTVPLVQAGYDPDQGVDKRLRAAAVAIGKPIHAFETAEQQVRIFADLSPEQELAALTEALDDIDAGPAFIASMMQHWLAGDTAALDKDISADMRKQSPALYKAVFLDRNTSWTRRIEQLMGGKGTIFIAVGAGHLVGDDSVIAMLERDGYKVTRE